MAYIIVQKNTQTRNSGYSLVEITITLTIIATLTISAISKFLINNKNSAETFEINQLVNDITFAKHYAIAKSMPLYICPSKDMQYCTDSWGYGYLIYNNAGKPIRFHKHKLQLNLTLHYFGLQNNKITISNLGTTINNGHFVIRNSLKNTYICWNNKLRIYIKDNPC